jgi:hypothetical protein
MRIAIQKLYVIALAGMLVISVLGSTQRSSSSVPNNFPLNLWSAHQKVTQIPWTVSFGKPILRSDFRQEFSIQAVIRKADLEKIGNSSDLILFMRVLDGNMPITGIYSGVPNPLIAPISPGPQMRLSGEVSVVPQPEYRIIGTSWTKFAIARPGKYKLELALLDRSSGRHSALYEDISVPGNENDPLEKALHELPRFEFGERTPVPIIRHLAISTSNSMLNQVLAQPGTMGPPVSRLFHQSDIGISKETLPPIPIERSGTLHLSVLTILSPPDDALDNEDSLAVFRENLIGFLSAFLRLDVLHGTAKLTAVDLTNRRLVFDRQDMNELPLETIAAEIKKDANTVSIDALAGARESGRFFRDVLRAQFEAAENDAEGSQHIIVIVASRTAISGVSNVQPLTTVRDCHCRVIYLRFAVRGGADDIGDLLKSYKPQVFEPTDWPQFRKDFGTIYQQLIR